MGVGAGSGRRDGDEGPGGGVGATRRGRGAGGRGRGRHSVVASWEGRGGVELGFLWAKFWWAFGQFCHVGLNVRFVRFFVRLTEN
jgi:hypothetical protein